MERRVKEDVGILLIEDNCTKQGLHLLTYSHSSIERHDVIDLPWPPALGVKIASMCESAPSYSMNSYSYTCALQPQFQALQPDCEAEIEMRKVVHAVVRT